MKIKLHIYDSGYVSTPGIDFGPQEVVIHYRDPQRIVLKVPGSSSTSGGYARYYPARFLVLDILEEGEVLKREPEGTRGVAGYKGGAPAYRWFKTEEVFSFPVKGPDKAKPTQEALAADRARSLPDAVRESLRENPLPPGPGPTVTGPELLDRINRSRRDALNPPTPPTTPDPPAAPIDPTTAGPPPGISSLQAFRLRKLREKWGDQGPDAR